MFQLTKEEWEGLKCQIGISNTRGGDRRSLPYVFTEQGVSQLSGVLHNELAEKMSVKINRQPADPRYDSNYWLCTITIDEDVKVKGQEDAYKTIVTGAVGGAAGVIHAAESATTDCQPNENVEALRVFMDAAGIEARPVWKPMHKQPVYCASLNEKGKMTNEKLPCGAICQTSGSSVAYVNGVSEEIFKVGMCLPAGPYVTDDDVKYIVECIKSAIIA